TNTNNDVVVITDKVTWTSSDSTLVTINSAGLATAIKIGETTIKAAIDDINSSLYSLEVVTDEYLQLFKVDAAEEKVNFPYYCYPNTDCLEDIPDSSDSNIVVETFKLSAVGRDFTIKNLKVTDFDGTVDATAKFTDLDSGDTIKEGESLTFSLEYTKGSESTRELIYSFTIDDESFPSFVASYLYDTN
ncbi:MAG: Ig-like domain-containing protein, partial [Campylobacterota bacterium]|nr:Ig-like domain-containing protein [Campylobacterota bacterium]